MQTVDPLENIDAFYKYEDGYLWAKGPWTELSAIDESSEVPNFLLPNFSAFYSNRKWLRPTKWGTCKKEVLVKNSPSRSSLQVQWLSENADVFRRIFLELYQAIHEGQLDKIVPAYCWKGMIEEKVDFTFFVATLIDAEPSLHPYYLHYQGKQIVGVTPELLFSKSGKQLQTQAVAGTGAAEKAEELLKQKKDIKEHKIVANYLEEKLRTLGIVERHPLKAQVFSVLAHLITDFDVRLNSGVPIDSLLALLHPTPALGVFPRTGPNLEMLLKARQECGVDLSFGAPIGYVWKDNASFWVGIRNILIQDLKVELNTGCGVVLESEVEKEWKELKLKKDFICKTLNLAT